MKRKKLMVLVLAALVVVGVAGTAFALGSGGAAGDVGFELYDLIVNKFIKGPIGATSGVVMMVVGAAMMAMGKLSGAVYPLVGGGVLASSSALANSLGMIF